MDRAILMGLGLAGPAGLNAYIPLLVVAIADRVSDRVVLDRPFGFLSSTLAILVIHTLLTIELVIDKIPRIGNLNDLLQTVIRPASGALVLMAVVHESDAMNPGVAMFLGMIVAGFFHWMKMMARPRITQETGGIGTPLVSMVEDGIAMATVVLAILVPIAGVVAMIGSVPVLRMVYRSVLHLKPGSRVRSSSAST